MTPVLDRRTFLKGLGVVTVAAACGGAATPTATTPAAASATPTAAPVAGTISVYSALNESTNNEFFGAYKKAYPNVTVNVLPLAAAGELQTRIRTEKASPKADIFIGGSSEFHDPLGKEGLLEAYIAPNAKDIDAKFKEATGLWTGWYTGIFGFISNNDRLSKELGNKKPATWDDLLDPAWKGKLVLPDPVKTGGGYIFIATQIFRFNKEEAKAMDFMKKLHANIAQYVATSPGALTLIDQGQFVGCPNWAHDILTEKGKGNPIDLSIPSDTGFEVGAVSIVKGTKNLAAAQALVNWSITKEAGELNVKLSNRGSTRTDVAPAAGSPKLSDVKLVNYDRQWATDNKDRLLKLWQQTVGL
ncbi:MAG TPA: extracellular solute-binding protein [Candidatus Limnocylindria bacterium]|jgi:iron(III) transport system substrate-binding protein|nr:extracellular solute-binding protein [Candidatus Limnocylindria bacterium]